MADGVLLVDYENIGKVDLGAIPAGVRVPFFFGASQKSVPTEFLRAALKLGERFVPIDIEGQGKNALDFHIAFYLGEYLARSPEIPCVILSKDEGFDPLDQTPRQAGLCRAACQLHRRGADERGGARREGESPDLYVVGQCAELPGRHAEEPPAAQAQGSRGSSAFAFFPEDP